MKVTRLAVATGSIILCVLGVGLVVASGTCGAGGTGTLGLAVLCGGS
jgi:hypothetical protein